MGYLLVARIVRHLYLHVLQSKPTYLQGRGISAEDLLHYPKQTNLHWPAFCQNDLSAIIRSECYP